MEVSAFLQHTQYAIPVGIVLVCAFLVFAFGFKKAEQPPFAHLSGTVSDTERKAQNKKRSKTKEKRAANGQVAFEKTSPSKKSTFAKAESATKKSNKSDEVNGKLKERKQDDNKTSANKKDKAQDIKSGKENKVEQAKNKKNLKNLLQEKPLDYDEGDWEQAYSRKDKLKKKREEETPSKKLKKPKKADLINEVVNEKEQEKPEIKDKITKETENKELKEKDNKEVILTPFSNEVPEKEKEVEKIEEKSAIKHSPKVEKVEKEEKKSGKGKKTKKHVDIDNAKPALELSLKEDKKPVNETVAEKKASDIASKIDPIESVEINQKEEKGGIASFDELGDVWKEAKSVKKSKKKSRKDN